MKTIFGWLAIAIFLSGATTILYRIINRTPADIGMATETAITFILIGIEFMILFFSKIWWEDG